MPRSRFRWFYLFIYFFISNQNFLLSELLPDNVVFMGRNESCSVKKLQLKDRVVSSMITSYRQRNKYSKVSGIKLNRSSVNSATLLTLESTKKTISSILVGHNQKFCIQINNYSKSFVWLEAENLKQNMFLLGYNNKKFRVRAVVVDAAKGSYLAGIVGGRRGVIVPYPMVKAVNDIVLIKHIATPAMDTTAMNEPMEE